MLLLTYLSEALNQRALMGFFTQVWFLPCIIALAVLPAETSKWGSYALVTILLSYPSRKHTPHFQLMATNKPSASNASRLDQSKL